jgi:Beta-glucosidase-related glycosidases
VCVARDDRWGRTYESFGETPDLPSEMTTLITGFQGDALSDPTSILATAKHSGRPCSALSGAVWRCPAESGAAGVRACHLLAWPAVCGWRTPRVNGDP